jgi:hypothetical protein
MSSRRFRSRRNARKSAAIDSNRGAVPSGVALNPQLRLIGGFPDRVRVTLRYTEKFTMTSSTVTTQYLFAGNDLYDPNITGTGGQPNNFDDWMVQYTRFKVHGSRFRLTMKTTNQAYLALVSVGARQGQATGTVDDDVSRPRHQVYWSNADGPPMTYDSSYTTSQVLGYTKGQYEGTEGLDGTASASPSRLWFWGVRHESYDDSTAVSTSMMAVIDYDVEFFQRLDQTLDLTSRVSSVYESKRSRAEKKEEKKSERGYELVELAKSAPATPFGQSQSQGTLLTSRGAVPGGLSLQSALLSRNR